MFVDISKNASSIINVIWNNKKLKKSKECLWGNVYKETGNYVDYYYDFYSVHVDLGKNKKSKITVTVMFKKSIG